MVFQKKLLRWHLIALAAGLVFIALYFLLFQPLAKRSHRLDRELQNAWTELQHVNAAHGQTIGMDVAAINASFTTATKEVHNFLETTEWLRERFELEPEFRQPLRGNFQLATFEEKRFQLIGEVNEMARKHEVELAFSRAKGFPVYSAAVEKPPLLWGQLALVHDLLTLAIANELQTIQEVNLLSIRARGSAGGKRIDWHEIPIHLKLIGAMDRIQRFLISLPLSTVEIRQRGFPSPKSQKPPLFIERIVMKRGSEAPEQIHIELVVNGFIAT